MSHLKFYFIFAIVLFLSFAQLKAQSFQRSHFNVEDGLASNEAFSTVQDKQGYIWIATDKGISRFNGNEFKTYGMAEGLKSTVIFKVLASPFGGIVFQGADNKVGFIKNDTVKYLQSDKSYRIGSIYSMRKGFVVVYNKNSYYEIYNWHGEKLESKSYPNGIYLIEIGDSCGFSLSGDSLSTFVRKDGENIPLKFFNHNFSGLIYYAKYKSSTIIVSNGSFINLKENNEFTKMYISGNPTRSSFVDSKGRLWIGLHGKGVEVFSVEEGKLLFRLMENQSVSSIYEDIEGNIWLSSLGNGLTKLTPNFYEPIIKGSVKRILQFKKQIVAIVNDSTLFFYHLDSGLEERIKVNDGIIDLLAIENKLFVSLHSKRELELKDSIETLVAFPHSKLGNYQGQPIGIMYEFHYYFDNNNTIVEQEIEIESGYTYVVQGINESVYVGRPRGLYKLDLKNDYSMQKVLSIPVTSIKSIADQFILGTKGHGLLFASKDFSIKKQYSSSNGLSGNFISAIKTIGDTIISGTENGIDLISNFSDSNHTRIISSTSSDGLWSGNTTGLLLINNNLFVSTDKGIQKISISDIDKPQRNPRPIVEYLNDRSFDPSEIVIVKAGTDRIKVNLDIITFQEEKKSLREYRLLGRDSNWVSTASLELEFLDLSPGNYELQFRTKLSQNKKYSVATVKFELLPLFVQTSLFRILFVIILLILVFIVIYLRDKSLKAKNESLLFQEQLRYKTLTAQLNPHFMFNALGSIQNLIITKKNKLAAEYLASFSGLIDKTLQNTNHLFIPLVDEIEFIEEYIGVEKSRFEKPFEFSWQIAKELDKHEVLVPTMFLQPYIENSIIHGINPLKTMGRIEVSIIRLREGVLEIRIVDNGIGIKAAEKVKGKRARKSLAMSNIQTRIQTMGKLYKDTFRQQISELIKDDGSVSGTLVIIDIPYKLKAEK